MSWKNDLHRGIGGSGRHRSEVGTGEELIEHHGAALPYMVMAWHETVSS